MHENSEQELLDYAANNVITVFKVCEAEEGRFRLVISVSWRHTDCVLASVRKRARVWANLNTLARYIRGLNRPTVPVHLCFYYRKGCHGDANRTR
jgi:hypothetical protein